ncbi:MAG: hypothetical protein GWN58_41885, partial [Anaerolineae bacterium]|nr:hypothetical protein [Anaerolineae bacterium]
MENYLGVNGLFNVIRGGTQRFHQLNLELGKTPAFQELARLWSKIATPSTPTIGEEFTDLARQTNIHSYNQRVNALQQEALNEVATARAQINEALGDLTRLTKRRSWIQRGDGSFRSTRGAITDDEILFLVNWTMRRMDELEGESLAEAAEKVISHFVGDAVKGEKIAESLSLNIQAAVKRYHKVFNLVGKEAKRTGVDVNDLIDEDKLARGMYVPRRWIDDATIEHRAALEDMIANEIRAGGLQDEQLQAVREALIGDMGKADFEQQFPELADPNVNFADLPEEVQLDLEDFWREITATDAQVELARREIELEKALKADLTAGKEVLLRAEVAKYQKLLKKSETLRKKLDKAKGGEKVKTRNLLFKNDQEIEKQARKLKTLNDHYRSRDAVLKSLNEMKRKGGKKGTEAAKLAKKIEGKQERAASIKRRLNDRQGIIDNLTPSKLAKKMLRNLNNKKLHGDTDVGLDIMFEPGDASAMKARQLPLARAVDEFDPRLNDLMSNDLNQTMRTYVDQVGTRNFWADEFGDMNPMEVINKHLEDIDPKYHGEIQALFEHLFNRQLGIHSLKG